MNDVKENLRKVQTHCTQILFVIDKICRENGIQYSLTAGSVIGAHLYQGIIPWDDDIDIMMTRENYEKFLAVCDKALPERYSVKNLENRNSKYFLLTKIVDEGTTVVEQDPDGRLYVGGVFVDISVFDKYPRGKGQRCRFKVLSRVVQLSRDVDYVRDFKNKRLSFVIKKTLRNILQAILKPVSFGLYTRVKKVFSNCKSKNYDYAELMFGLSIAYDPQIFSEYADVEFEGIKAMIVKDYMAYLETRYGRREFYKTQREGDYPHHLVYVDCNKPYREYNGKQKK